MVVNDDFAHAAAVTCAASLPVSGADLASAPAASSRGLLSDLLGALLTARQAPRHNSRSCCDAARKTPSS